MPRFLPPSGEKLSNHVAGSRARLSCAMCVCRKNHKVVLLSSLCVHLHICQIVDASALKHSLDTVGLPTLLPIGITRIRTNLLRRLESLLPQHERALRGQAESGTSRLCIVSAACSLQMLTRARPLYITIKAADVGSGRGAHANIVCWSLAGLRSLRSSFKVRTTRHAAVLPVRGLNLDCLARLRA